MSAPPGAFETRLDARELRCVPDAPALVARLRDEGLPWWLDSAMQAGRLGRFSFLGADPYLVLRARGREAELEIRRPVRPDLDPGATRRVADPFELVRSLLAPVRSMPTRGVPPVPFVGGAVGYFGYELGACVESLDLRAREDGGPPDLALLFVDRLVAIDHARGRAWAIGTGFGRDEREALECAARAREDVESLAGSAPAAGEVASVSVGAPSRLGAEPPGLETFFGAGSYAAAVDEIRGEIAAGNVYQANLTQRMDLRLEKADPLTLYRDLRALNPAPFAAYLELPEVAVLSSSPERFLRLDPERAVESRPIKGTRPRGGTLEDDHRLRAELLASEKDRAENLMIADLVRNDLGRVCALGSVDVPELMSVESYATVFQMVSAVTGVLREDCDVVDLVRASFPPGSMTGAPKLAAIRLIDRLEPVRRGIYSGALGYLDARGGCDLSVVIRTLVLEAHAAHLHVGGGIVADSVPHDEYLESLDKARALLAVLARVATSAPIAATSV